MKDLKFNDAVLMVKNCDHDNLIDISDDISNLKEENKRMREALVKSQSDIKVIIDHLFSLGLDEAWVICKLNEMFGDVSYGLNGK